MEISALGYLYYYFLKRTENVLLLFDGYFIEFSKITDINIKC